MLQKYPLNTFEAHQNKQNFNCAKKNISDFIVFGPWIGAAWCKYRILLSEMNTINKSENKQNSETNENYYAFKFIWMVLLQSNMATARTHSFIHSINSLHAHLSLKWIYLWSKQQRREKEECQTFNQNIYIFYQIEIYWHSKGKKSHQNRIAICIKFDIETIV